LALTFASYNIHKAVGLDGRRDPDRILAILREIDADVIALQETDRRFGRREAVLPRHAILSHTPWQVVPLAMTPDGMGWHGNTLLVRDGIEVIGAEPVQLPALEPRGAICAELRVAGRLLRVVAMHLDLSGLRRRMQMRAVLAHLERSGHGHLGGDPGGDPAVLLGDFNEWSVRGGCLREFGRAWRVLAPGRSYPARRPLAQLDRIVVSPGWQVLGTGVHHSVLAARGSDHLPVYARLALIPAP
jgi:endonuclease/exonuclease/phosphatase family metal-dependent hydrolase